MFIEATKLMGLPVAAEDTLSKVGEIRQVVVDPENGRVLGFLVKTGFFVLPLALSIIDIKFWDSEALVISEAKNLVQIKEIVRIKNILEQKIDLLGMPAKTEAGKSLGRVENFLIDTDAESVVKYYLKDLLGQTRVMPAEKVCSIDKVIVFADDEAGITSGITEAQIA